MLFLTTLVDSQLGQVTAIKVSFNKFLNFHTALLFRKFSYFANTIATLPIKRSSFFEKPRLSKEKACYVDFVYGLEDSKAKLTTAIANVINPATVALNLSLSCKTPFADFDLRACQT